MFVTALAPNALAISIIFKTTNIQISWIDWFKGFAPVGFVLLLLVPFLLYKLYPPEIKESPEAPRWAADELQKMGPIGGREIKLLVLVLAALTLWIGGGAYIDPAMVAVSAVAVMVIMRVVPWNDVIGYAAAWNVLVWFATLLTLAGGLAETKFVDWVAQSIAPQLSGLGVYASIVGVVGCFFLLHYFFASITAHTATLFPVFLGIAIAIPVLSPTRWALLLAYSLGLMGIISPYGGAHMAIYYGSGYIKGRDFWVLGLVQGIIYFVVYIAIIVPWLEFLGY
jgi:L-tartrate/succinate antiporter